MSDIEAILETGGAAAVELAASALAERGGRIAHCANCREPLLGPYCAVCGQPRDIHRRSIAGLLRDLVQDIASFDSRILRTARALLFEPGELARAFHEGRTQPYVPAVRLYLFVSLLFFLLLSSTGIALVQFRLESQSFTSNIDRDGTPYEIQGGEKIALPKTFANDKVHYNVAPDMVFFARTGTQHSNLPKDVLARFDRQMHAAAKQASAQGASLVAAIDRSFDRLATDPAALNGTISAWVPRALFLLLPLFALLLAAFYWRQRKEFLFVDHLIFSLSFHSFVFALLLIAALAAQMLSGGVVGLAVVAAVLVYLLLAMRRQYRQSWLWTGVKFASLSTIYTLFFLLPALLGILALSFLGINEPKLELG